MAIAYAAEKQDGAAEKGAVLYFIRQLSDMGYFMLYTSLLTCFRKPLFL